jgi:hypothetical protein
VAAVTVVKRKVSTVVYVVKIELLCRNAQSDQGVESLSCSRLLSRTG